MALALARLRGDVSEDQLEAAQFAIRDIAQAVDGPVKGSSLSRGRHFGRNFRSPRSTDGATDDHGATGDRGAAVNIHPLAL